MYFLKTGWKSSRLQKKDFRGRGIFFKKKKKKIKKNRGTPKKLFFSSRQDFENDKNLKMIKTFLLKY